MTKNINESNAVGEIPINYPFIFNNETYYAVRRVNIHNFPEIVNIISETNTQYELGRGGTSDILNCYILNEPPLKSKDLISIKFKLTYDQFYQINIMQFLLTMEHIQIFRRRYTE